jgi:hypothetical protein
MHEDVHKMEKILKEEKRFIKLLKKKAAHLINEHSNVGKEEKMIQSPLPKSII